MYLGTCHAPTNLPAFMPASMPLYLPSTSYELISNPSSSSVAKLMQLAETHNCEQIELLPPMEVLHGSKNQEHKYDTSGVLDFS